ncbi:hypothetical protein [Planctomicrobium sp. SH664]|uniref:hypothetical protein n=1 Tax=Planctomicrobium sp. SH664 TaxID=3448125 RepID=UPI003F5C4166
MKRVTCGRLAGFSAAWFGTTIAWGHPGHGTVPSESPLHYIVEPIHGCLVLAALAAGLALWAFRLRKLRQQSAPVRIRERNGTSEH